MRASNRSAGEQPLPLRAPTHEKRTVVGLGVPVSPSALRLDDEETVAYDTRQSPDGSLSTLLAECGRKSVVDDQDVDRTVAERQSHTAPRGASAGGEPDRPLTSPEADQRPSATRPRSFHTVPAFPDELGASVEPVDSNLHRMDQGMITDSLAPAPRQATDPPSMEPFEVRPPDPPPRRIKLDLTDRPDSVLPAVRPKPTRRRTMFARMLFLTITVAVVLVAASAFSIATHRPGLDPRPHLARAAQVATEALRALPKKLAR